MKIKPEDLAMKHLGCVCFLDFFTKSKESIGHSQRYGIEMGDVAYSHTIVGILTGLNEKEIILSCYIKVKHALMTYSGEICRISTSSEEIRIPVATICGKGKFLYINTDTKSNSIEQHAEHELRHLMKFRKIDSKYTRALRQLVNYARTLKKLPPRK